MNHRHWILVPFTLVACSTNASSTTGSTTSALSGTVDGTAATECATTFVDCIRNGGTTCADDAASCIEAATTATTTTTTTTDGGTGGKGRKGGKCHADGSIDKTDIEACLTTLETCASGDTAAETCVSDAITCLTASSSSSSSGSRTTTSPN